MKEAQIASLLEEYRDSLGSCERLPQRRKGARRILLFSPIGVAAAIAVGIFVWPRIASGATFRRLGDAITNARSMESLMYVEDQTGERKLWQVTRYEAGKWRNDYVVNEMRTPVSMIFRDALCYEFHGDLPYATVRPSSAAFNAPQMHGQALEVIENELTNRYKGSTMSLASGNLVEGKPTYRVLLDRTVSHIHIELVVNQETDLPISADMSSDWKPYGRTHWDYAFNAPFPEKDFEVPKNKRLVDLRKTIPAFEAAHRPLLLRDGLTVLDACVTRDGTVWIATKSTNTKLHVDLRRIEVENGVRYTLGGNVVVEGLLSKQHKIDIFGFAPLDPVAKTPTACKLTLGQSTISRPISDTAVTASQVLAETGSVSLPLRSEAGTLPGYFPELGMEDDLANLPFDMKEARAWALEKYGRFLEAGRIWEQIGLDAKAVPNAFRDWMDKALTDFTSAKSDLDVARVERELKS